MDRTKIRRILRTSAMIALALPIAAVAYAAAGLLLSLVPDGGDGGVGGDVTVYIESNGVHTDIVMPTVTERIDWSRVAPPGDTDAGIRGEYIAAGWGSRDFYLNVPEWKDLTCGVAFRAISGTGGTALHMRYSGRPEAGPDCRRLSLSSAQYDALVKYVLASGRLCEDGRFVRIHCKGYGPHDAFYEGTGRYSMFRTCNTWTNSALKECGQRCCLWTAFGAPIFWKHPLESGAEE